METERKLGYTVRLGKTVDQCTKEDILKIKALVEQHGVICIKNQDLEAINIYKFCTLLGSPMALPAGLAFYNQEDPYVTRIGNVKTDGSVEPNQQASLYWHSDGDITEAPNHFIYIMLNAKLVPPVGGRTGFLDMRTLYREAPEETKEWLKDSNIEVRIADIDDFMGAPEAENMPKVTHKVNQVHPVRGIPQFYLCAHQGHVTLKTGERMKTPDVMEKVFNEKYMYAHVYEQGDLIIWDDIQVHHKSLGGFGNNPRLLFRGQVQVGEVPELIEYVKNTNLGTISFGDGTQVGEGKDYYQGSTAHNHYDAIIKISETFPYHDWLLLVDTIPNLATANILDAGCGNGLHTKLLSTRTKGEVYGVDISDDMLKLAAEGGSSQGGQEGNDFSRVKFKNVDLTTDICKALELPHEFFDVVNVCWVIQHSHNAKVLLDMVKSLSRSLKRGGSVIGIILNPDITEEYINKPKAQGITYRRKDQYAPVQDGELFNTMLTDKDGKILWETNDYYYTRETYLKTFKEAGFSKLEFIPFTRQDREGEGPMLIKAAK